ncbi:MAG: hypothetical protein GY711_31885 [bacterium]|nr:hypothetical protein [bacterium]
MGRREQPESHRRYYCAACAAVVVVVVCRRCDRGQMSLDIDHYLPLLARKCRGLDRAVPVRRFLEREDPCWRTLLADLRSREGEAAGSRAFVDVLHLCREYDVEIVTEAVRKSVRHPEISLGLVRFHLWNELGVQTAETVTIEYPSPEVHQGSPSVYACLTTTTEEEEVSRA